MLAFISGPQARKRDRSVDLIKFNGYTDLIAELDEMFDFKGQLKGSNKE